MAILPIIKAPDPRLKKRCAPVDRVELKVKGDKPTVAVFLGKPGGGEDRRPGEGDNSRSDTMMLVRLDPRTKTMSMLSFPRDLVVNVPGYGRRPINEAFELGAEPLALATVKELTGVQVNYLVPVDFRAFKIGRAHV